MGHVTASFIQEPYAIVWCVFGPLHNLGCINGSVKASKRSIRVTQIALQGFRASWAVYYQYYQETILEVLEFHLEFLIMALSGFDHQDSIHSSRVLGCRGFFGIAFGFGVYGSGLAGLLKTLNLLNP